MYRKAKNLLGRLVSVLLVAVMLQNACGISVYAAAQPSASQILAASLDDVSQTGEMQEELDDTSSETGEGPASEPGATPAAEPTETPVAEPTVEPSAEPAATPAAEPTATPTLEPTATPAVEPTVTPMVEPTATPTAIPELSRQELMDKIEELLEKSSNYQELSEEELESLGNEMEAIAQLPMLLESQQDDEELAGLLERLNKAQKSVEGLRLAYQAKREGWLDQLPQTGKENSWRYQDGELIIQEEQCDIGDLPDGVDFFSAGGYKGIDVSHHQGVIDWEAVKASGIDFAIIRCGYGMNIESQDDAQWSRNVRECERLGIPYGVYLYSYAVTAEMAVDEARHALRLLEGHNPDLPVFLDLEENQQLVVGNSGLAEIARIFCDIVSSKGYEVGVYASLNWWNHYLTDAVFENWYRWVAEWRSSCSYNGRYEIWQYTSEGHVNGINGYVDMNYWYGPMQKPVQIKEGTYTLHSFLNYEKVVDIAGGSKENGGNVQLYQQNELAVQEFKIRSVNDNYYILENVHSGKVMEAAGTSLGANVRQWEYSGKATQQWCFVDAGNGYYYLKNRASGLYLDLKSGQSKDGTNVQLYRLNKSSAQKFRLEWKGTTVTVEEGIYTIALSANQNLVMDIAGGSKNDGAKAQLYHSNGLAPQQYAIKSVGNGYYTITNVHSQKSLDVSGGSKTPGTAVHQWTSSNSKAQQWKFVDAGNGAVYIQSRCNGLFLDVKSGKLASGSALQMYTPNWGNAQKFKLLSTEQ